MVDPVRSACLAREGYGTLHNLRVILLAGYSRPVRITWPASFATRVEELRKGVVKGDRLSRKRLAALRALLEALRELPSKPEEESATFKRVRQARRRELWRVAHPYDRDVAVRVIVWFPSDGEVVVALLSFDKAKLGDVWYDRASIEGQALVDQWLRQHPSTQEE
jgi:hypothetical protein